MCTFGFAAVYSAIIAFSTALPWASVLLHIVMVTSPAGAGQSFGVAAMSGTLPEVATEPAGLLVEVAGDGAVDPPAHEAPMSPSVKSEATNDRRTFIPPPAPIDTARGISRRHIVRQRCVAQRRTRWVLDHERRR